MSQTSAVGAGSVGLSLPAPRSGFQFWIGDV
jgi:hypothetical protein